MPTKPIIGRNLKKESTIHYLHGRSAPTVSVPDTVGTSFRVAASGP